MTKKPTVLQNIGWGLQYGVGLAIFCSLLIGVLALRRGSDWNPTYQVSTRSVMFGYGVAGVLGGILIGLLRPLITGRFMGALVGMMIGAFGYSAIMIAVEGMAAFDPGPAILAGILVGGAVGFKLAGESRKMD